MSVCIARLTFMAAFLSVVQITLGAPARGEPDLSSPKAAARSLYQAVDAEDGEAILKIFYAKDDTERELAKAFADLIVSGKKLADAVKAKFNTTGESFGAGMIGKEELAKLERAEVKEE